MDDIVDRLRGKYSVGPHLPNGDPEFGWRQFQATPINLEAADYIEELRKIVATSAKDSHPAFMEMLDHFERVVMDGLELRKQVAEATARVDHFREKYLAMRQESESLRDIIRRRLACDGSDGVWNAKPHYDLTAEMREVIKEKANEKPQSP